MISTAYLPGFTPASMHVHPHPVHRDSTRLPVKWHSLGKRAAHTIYYAAKRFDCRTKEAGRHGGRVGHAAMEVLRVLVFEFYSYASGRLDPSYEAIARKANVARSTAAAALKRLRDLGIITWVRRCSDSYEDGVYVLCQETNAYGLVPAGQWADAADLPAPVPGPDAASWGATPPMPELYRQAQVALARSGDYGAAARILRQGGPLVGLDAVLARRYEALAAEQASPA